MAVTVPLRVVVKLGGEVIASEGLHDVAADVAELRKRGHAVFVVHGGGPQTTALQKRLGQSPRVLGGRRVTDADALDAIKLVVAGRMNVDLCAALFAAGGRPVGLHGASSGVISATRRPPRVVQGGGPESVDLGFVGDVTGVGRDLLELLNDAGYTPVLACVGADERGQVFNINADIVANRVALEMKADALVLLSDVAGVLRDVSDPSSRIASMTRQEARQAIDEGVVTKGMIPKLEESFAALEQGLGAVYIVGRLARGELVRAVLEPGTVGTVLRNRST